MGSTYIEFFTVHEKRKVDGEVVEDDFPYAKVSAGNGTAVRRVESDEDKAAYEEWKVLQSHKAEEDKEMEEFREWKAKKSTAEVAPNPTQAVARQQAEDAVAVHQEENGQGAVEETPRDFADAPKYAEIPEEHHE